MLSIDQVKELLEDPSLTDEQIGEIRDACRGFAELMLENWLRQQSEEQMFMEKNL